MAARYRLLTQDWHDAIRALVRSARRELYLATPFVTLEGVKVLDSARQSRELCLSMIVNASGQNACSRSCDPRALQYVLSRFAGATVCSLAALHAKIYVADRHTAIIGSANLTGGGLWRNVECGVETGDRKAIGDIVREFRSHLRVSAPLDARTVAGLEALAADWEQGATRGAQTEERRRTRLAQRASSLVADRLGDGRTLHAVFVEAIQFVLQHDGPLKTEHLHPRIQVICGALCDDSELRIIKGRSYGPKWKHRVRSAQQHLKAKGLVAYDARTELWRSLVP